jgi:hypothetical protein
MIRRDIVTSTSEHIYCDISHKLLARKDNNGLWLWCKECKCEHYYPFIPNGNGSDINCSPSRLISRGNNERR